MKKHHWIGRKHSAESKVKMAKAKAAWWKGDPKKIEHARAMIKKNHARPALGKKGPLAPGWKGGRYTTERDKYIFVWAPDHPNAKKSGKGTGGYVLEHRLVMEKVLGRYLLPEEDVNHINGIKDDNRPENLALVSHFAHYEKHGCPKCGFKFLTR